MKKLLKLVPALAMLLIAATLVSTSTYAWFTMNATVTATGMQIKAQSSSNLLIAYSSDGSSPADSAYKTSDTAGMSNAAAIAPCSTTDLVNWYQAIAAAPNAAAASTAAYTSATVNNNYILKYFYLKSGANCTVYLSSVKISGTNVSFGANGGNEVGMFYNSIRIGVKMGDSFRIYAPDAGTANGSTYTSDNVVGKGYASTGVATITNFTAMTAGTQTTGTTNVNNFSAGEAATFGSLTANTGERAEVYIWLEGEDGACYTNNIGLNDITFELTFSKVEPTT